MGGGYRKFLFYVLLLQLCIDICRTTPLIFFLNNPQHKAKPIKKKIDISIQRHKKSV